MQHNQPTNELRFDESVENSVISDDLLEDDAPRDEVKYEDRVVAFLDILGFSELIRESRHDVDLVSKIVDALQNPGFHQYIDSAETHTQCQDIKISTFSDCVVVSAPNNQDGLMAVIFTVWMITKDWLSKGFMSRGGISCGQLLHTKHNVDVDIPSMVFGPAFLEAYQTEHQVADVARVLLHKSARSKFQEYEHNQKSILSQLVIQCPDGPYAVDVFAHLRSNGFNLGTDPLPDVEQFQKELQSKLNSALDNPRHFAKIKWLVEQFNEALDGSEWVHFKIEFTP